MGFDIYKPYKLNKCLNIHQLYTNKLFKYFDNKKDLSITDKNNLLRICELLDKKLELHTKTAVCDEYDNIQELKYEITSLEDITEYIATLIKFDEEFDLKKNV